MAEYTIIYNGVNITDNISKEVEYIRFTDNLKGNADDIEININNYSGKWYGPFRPEKGDIIELQIGELLCGAFEVDSIVYNLLPKTVIIQAQSARLRGKSTISKLSRGYQNTSLFSVVRDLAAILKVKPEFYCEDVPISEAMFPNISIGGILNSLCNRYGYDWKITNRTGPYGETIKNKLIVVNRNIITTENIAFTIKWGESTVVPGSISIEDVSKSFRKRRVRYLDPDSFELTELVVEDDNDLLDDEMPEDTVVITGKEAKLALSREAKKIQSQEKLTGSLQMKGNEKVVAGTVFKFDGWDYPNNDFIDNRPFLITKATHIYDVQSGWLVDIEFEHTKKTGSAR